jgi:heme A synthase
MKVRLQFLIPAVILLLLGLVWTLQGAGVLGGSVMTGQRQWLVIGLVLVVVGLVLGYLGLGARAQRA